MGIFYLNNFKISSSNVLFTLILKSSEIDGLTQKIDECCLWLSSLVQVVLKVQITNMKEDLILVSKAKLRNQFTCPGP